MLRVDGEDEGLVIAAPYAQHGGEVAEVDYGLYDADEALLEAHVVVTVRFAAYRPRSRAPLAAAPKVRIPSELPPDPSSEGEDAAQGGQAVRPKGPGALVGRVR